MAGMLVNDLGGNEIPYCDDTDCCDPAEIAEVREKLAAGAADHAHFFEACPRCLRSLHGGHSLHCTAADRRRVA